MVIEIGGSAMTITAETIRFDDGGNIRRIVVRRGGVTRNITAGTESKKGKNNNESVHYDFYHPNETRSLTGSIAATFREAEITKNNVYPNFIISIAPDITIIRASSMIVIVPIGRLNTVPRQAHFIFRLLKTLSATPIMLTDITIKVAI